MSPTTTPPIAVLDAPAAASSPGIPALTRRDSAPGSVTATPETDTTASRSETATQASAAGALHHDASPIDTWTAAVRTAADDSCAWVRAEPFRAHVRSVLASTGLHWRTLAIAAGVPPRVVHTLLFGRNNRACRRIRAMDAASLLLFTPGTVERLANTPAPPGSIQTCLRALTRAGHTHAEVASWLCTPSAHVRRLAEAEVCGSTLVLNQLLAACASVGLDGVRVGQAPNPTAGVPAASLPLIARQRPTAAPVALSSGGPQTETPVNGLRDWAA